MTLSTVESLRDLVTAQSPHSVSSSLAAEFLRSVRTEGVHEPLLVFQVGVSYIESLAFAFSGDEGWDVLEQVFIAALELGESQTADGCLSRLARQFPRSVRVRRLYGHRAEARGDYDEAIKIYNDLTEYDPTDTSSMKRLVCIARDQGDLKKAITLLVNYLEVFMADTEAWLELAELYVELQLYYSVLICVLIGSYTNAAFCAEELILAHPYNSFFYTFLGDILYMERKYVEAFDNYSHSIELSNTLPNLRAVIGLEQTYRALPVSQRTKERQLIVHRVISTTQKFREEKSELLSK